MDIRFDTEREAQAVFARFGESFRMLPHETLRRVYQVLPDLFGLHGNVYFCSPKVFFWSEDDRCVTIQGRERGANPDVYPRYKGKTHEVSQFWTVGEFTPEALGNLAALHRAEGSERSCDILCRVSDGRREELDHW